MIVNTLILLTNKTLHDYYNDVKVHANIDCLAQEVMMMRESTCEEIEDIEKKEKEQLKFIKIIGDIE